MISLVSLLLSHAICGPINLRCEERVEPSGVDTKSPTFSWNLTGFAHQNAFRIIAASSPDLLRPGHADLWDSGMQIGSDSLGHIYRGKSLRSESVVFWKVEAWMRGKKPIWSAPSQFETGILEPSGWKANWIAGTKPSESLLLRRRFSLNKPIKRALLSVCGLGDCEVTLNQKRVGVDQFGSGWTQYRHTCLYQSFDLGERLRQGQNQIELLLGNGMYNIHEGRYTKFTGSFGELKSIGQLMVEFTDGTRQWIPTDVNWQTKPGPITFSSEFGGEDYDRRLADPSEGPGWAAAKVVPGPGGDLKGLTSSAAPIRLHESFAPLKVTRLRSGVEVYDFGQNVSLMPLLQVQGPAGSTVRMIPAELIHADGTVDRSSCGGGMAYWQYTLDGSGVETYFPKFFYHGSRYIQVERTSPTGRLPEVKSLTARAVYGNVDPVGDFSCSEPLFDRIYNLVRWAQKSNMMSVLTDCPHRERLGWLEQTHLNGPALRYNFDIAPIFSKLMSDMSDSQLPNGLVPDIAPELVVFSGGFRDSPEWGSACILGAWQQYLWTGDASLFRRHYAFMRKYLDYLDSKSRNNILDFGLGDWYDVGPNPPGYSQLTPVSFTATAIYYEDTRILAQVAKLLGRTSEGDRLDLKAEQIKNSFNQKFFSKATGSYSTGSQCANAMALSLNLVQMPEDRDRVLSHLVADLEARKDAITAGDIGYRYLLRALSENGRSDLVVKMNLRTSSPGYGYMLAKGATALTEAWNANPSSSQNHFMLGQINEWFFHDLAGIQPTEEGPGFAVFRFKPAIGCGISAASAKFKSVRGMISVSWKTQGNRISVDMQIPSGAKAINGLPNVLTTDGGQDIKPHEIIGPGAYHFRSVITADGKVYMAKRVK